MPPLANALIVTGIDRPSGSGTYASGLLPSPNIANCGDRAMPPLA